jgi:hypothetical protein
MYAVTAKLRRVPFVGSTTPTVPLRTFYNDEVVTWNTGPERVVGEDDRKPIYSRVCDCPLATGECCCAWTVQPNWML